MSSFFRKYRVDNLPALLHPLVQVYGLAGAASFLTYVQLLRRTSQWDVVTDHRAALHGMNNRKGTNVHFDRPCIHCLFHEHVPAYFAYYLPLLKSTSTSTPTANQHGQARTRIHAPHCWLQHPLAYMKPIHQILAWHEIEYILGSSGQGGQQALQQLIEKLSSDRYSTLVTPDGPTGPVRQVKRGVVDLARATKLPIVPIRFEYKPEKYQIRLDWDRKHFPFPILCSVRVHEMSPIDVHEDTDTQVLVKKLESIL